MAEERLFPSALNHKSSLQRIISKPSDETGELRLSIEDVRDEPDTVEAVGAFEVPRAKRLLQVALAVVYCLLAAGIVFGYAAFKPILVQEGVYRDRCTEEELVEGVRVCYQQELRLNFMFTVAAVATNVCALLVGTILDQYGPRVAGVIGSVLFASGCAGMAFSKEIQFIDPYPISYLLMAVGGPFIFIPSFHLANAFPHRSGLILSMLTGAFDSSSAIFLLYRMLYERLGGISLKEWFLGYLIVPVFILLVQLFVMPNSSYKTASELVDQVHTTQDIANWESDYLRDHESAEIESRLESRNRLITKIDRELGGHDGIKRSRLVEEKRETAGVWGVMHGKSVTTQLGSFWFWGIAGFTIIQMTRINYFVATIRPQYEFLLHSYPESVKINTFFDIALPLGGLFAIPFIGMVLDSLSTLTVLTVLVCIASTIGVLGLVENSTLTAYANILLFVAYRPFYYTVVSDYCAKVFGIATFGKVYGTVICLAGLFNFSQAGLDAITYVLCDGDPRPANLVLLLAAVVVGIALLLFVRSKGREARRQLLGEEARMAREENQVVR
ncbi:major facilitator superfamily domain-containing protein [Tricharina praecox]|uniref:major facilitator superfamily domain-containing protein n=1 Tax=Tricharina praecox TaxID=43433 RepID=UPI002220AE6B|nr:major facilitator superfamily domain-containing protein [Tricharina praecox]KAI5844935.1 major facilitator superfamily domain-containing protein [Tricharina praecox]